MSKRDEFSVRTKAAVAQRANHRCSFRGCTQITSGPSEEASDAVIMVGKAAHIHGASSGPGSRRYLASMSREERRHIDNAIWLCSTHADMIDRDDMTFTAGELRTMKREHEDSIRSIQRNAILTGISTPDFVALGQNIVFSGEFLGMENDEWCFQLRHFLDGDVRTLIAFIEGFEQAPAGDRYVLVNYLGDGRVLKRPPSMIREKSGGYIVHCPVLPSADRIRADELPKSYALSDTNDLYAHQGTIAVVSGVAALPQQIQTCLSHQRGESPIYHDFGTRLAEYYCLLSGSPWFDRYLKLEVIRQAAIPYVDTINNRRFTPLLCIERVHGIEVLADAPTKNWLPVRVDLDVKGVGRWQHDLNVCIPQERVKRPSFGELLAGPSHR